MSKEVTEWIYVDKIGLLVAITEAAWCAEVKSHKTDELYETIIDKNGESKKEINEHWSSTFWSLYSAYEMLLDSYTKKEPYDTYQESTARNDQGGVLSEGKG